MLNKKENTNYNFEQRLQNDAENYRMYPSDKVWDNIRVELHGKPKWPALLITFTTIVIALTVATALNYPPHRLFVKDNVSTLPEKKGVATKATKQNINATGSQKSIQARQSNTQTIPTFISLNNNLPGVDVANNATEMTAAEPIKNSDNLVANNSQEQNKNKALLVAQPQNVGVEKYNTIEEYAAVASNTSLANSIDALQIVEQKNSSIKNIEAENYINSFKKNIVAKPHKQSKWQVQYYAAITNSYRTLKDDKARLPYLNNSTERQALNNNVNDIVKHKPALGGEFGVSFLYKVTKNLFVKSGLQFNIRQYEIDAYRADGDATFSYVQNNQLSSFSVKSAYSTQEGIYKEKLQDKLYQVSIPIGLQWDAVDGERWGLSTAATIQPTVTLNKNVYVVSTDYKYYADGTEFFRRFNINTSAELYLTLKSKNSKWFFGPQVRYQQMPTYNDIYPIKEYRVDYGIKFGFVKSLR